MTGSFTAETPRFRQKRQEEALGGPWRLGGKRARYHRSSSSTAELHDRIELWLAHRLDRQARLLDDHHIGQRRLVLDALQGDRFAQGERWLDVDHRPVALARRWVGVGLRDHPGDARDAALLAGMIVESQVTRTHGADVVPRLEITHPIPARLAVAHQVAPRVRARLRF